MNWQRDKRMSQRIDKAGGRDFKRKEKDWVYEALSYNI